jgi:hypothetical protein
MAYTTINGRLVRTGSKEQRRMPQKFYSHVPSSEDERSRPAMPADKGELGGSCNRSHCLRPGANWYNHSTRKHYCRACAEDLNHYNRKDAHEIWGHDLCTLVESEQKEIAECAI